MKPGIRISSGPGGWSFGLFRVTFLFPIGQSKQTIQCNFMSNYTYVAVDPGGLEMRGTIEVSDQTEALRRIREMGLFPTKLISPGRPVNRAAHLLSQAMPRRTAISPRWFGRIKPSVLAVFTRQLATLLEAGMPLLRSLRLLQEQTVNRRLKATTAALALHVHRAQTRVSAASATFTRVKITKPN